MFRRAVIGGVLVLGLSGCEAAAKAGADEVRTISYVRSASPPVLVLTEKATAFTGGRAKSAKYRLDVREIAGGTQVGVYVFKRGEMRGAHCYPGEKGRVWCRAPGDVAIETWDVTTFEKTEDFDALTARFEGFASGLKNTSLVEIPGTGEIEIDNGRGESWIVGPNPVRDDGSDAYKERLRGIYAGQPDRQLSVGMSSEVNSFALRLDNEYIPAGEGEFKEARIPTDSATRRPIYWEEQKMTVFHHEVGGAEGTELELVGLGFDGSRKWSAKLGLGHASHTLKLEDAVVVVMWHDQKMRLLCVDLATGAMRWNHDL